MRKGWLIIISLVATIALLGVAGYTILEKEVNPALTADPGATQQGQISVTGQGRVSVIPDIAMVALGIEARADTVAEAIIPATEAMEAVIAALKAHGVEEKDIQTFHFSISQAWEWDKVGGSIPAGFLVSNMVRARIRALDAVGVIIDAVVRAGGDFIRIHGIDFTVEDPTPYHYEAREKAFANAKAKAVQLARLAGVTLGKPIFITENMAHFPPKPMAHRMEVTAVIEPGFVTPIIPGEQEVIINVQVTFAIE
ncbi:SIMPL domain-containing protein [Candidatus Acetothermia bacterium]|nr:SIMPL domain-containing protein [Candidatus Acetothermia bacterium]MCI2427747.1 SIMPL domain-containing protein [Candidatus Acetothermia bacterium]MCI2428050.1 SIMPL domain-containing protein [Candidatus Acetothermia bacterium]